MTRSDGLRIAVLRTLLLGSVALLALDPTIAAARVGVTSATDGDPLGKPPAEPERVLRIGIDVQANELITTGSNDRAHLVFLDGTSVTVGPNAQLTIDKFVYDPNTKTGELAVSASKGVLRLVGGKISKTTPITITTPSSTIGIRGGITIVEAQPTHTVSTFVFGDKLTASAQGQTTTVTRPGFRVVTNNGSPPGGASAVPPGGLTSSMGQLEGGKSGGQSTSGGGTSGGAGGPPAGGTSGGPGGPGNQQANAEQGAQNFGKQNSGQSPGGPPSGVGGPRGPVGLGNSGNLNNVNNAVANTGQQNIKGNAATNTSSSETRVIVSKGTLGRYLADTLYSGFNVNTLGITYDSNNYKTLDSPSNVTTTTTTRTTTNGNGSSTNTSTESRISVNIQGVGTVNLPWQTNTLTNGFSIDNFNALGASLRNGRGYVSANGEFFAYVFTTTGDNKVGIFGGTPTTTSGVGNFPTSGIAAFAIKNPAKPSQLPFTNDGIGNNTDLVNAKVVSSLYTVYSTTLGSTIGSAIPDPRSTALQATISISGTGQNQVSYMGTFIGQFLRDADNAGSGITRDNGVYLQGNFDATYRTSSNLNNADGKIGRLFSDASTPSNGTSSGNAIYGTPGTGNDGAASAMVIVPDKMETTNGGSASNVTSYTTTRTPQAAFNQPYTNLSDATNNYYFVTAATKTTTPSDVGTTGLRNNRSITGGTALNGFIGGIAEQVDSGSNFTTRLITTTDATKLQIETSADNNRAAAKIEIANWNGTNTAIFRLGGTTGSNVATSAYVDDNLYAMRDRSAGMTDLTTVGGSSTGVTSNTAMVSYNTAPINSLFSNATSTANPITKCVCSFMSWGWWGGDVAYGTGAAANVGGRDRLNFATYVAGTLANASQLPTGNIEATYNGHLAGNVDANGRQYIQVGSYSNTWNFLNRSGNTSVYFDGTSFSGTTSANAGSVNFNGSMTTGNKTLTLNGSFMGSGTPPQGQAGSFKIEGPNTGGQAYKAAGIFAAQK
jgi:hypothetical protein